MNKKIEILRESAQNKPNSNSGKFGVNPVVFTIWLLIIASVMLFAAFASAYTVHRADGIRNEAWLQFELPSWFWISALIAALSSFFIQKAYNAAKKDDIQLVPGMVFFTLIMGILFGISQFLGWRAMHRVGLFVSNQEAAEISASFVYVISFIHLLHIVIGMVLLGVTLYRSLKLKVHKKNLVFINISTTYWHFLGILWVAMLLFLHFSR